MARSVWLSKSVLQGGEGCEHHSMGALLFAHPSNAHGALCSTDMSSLHGMRIMSCKKLSSQAAHAHNFGDAYMLSSMSQLRMRRTPGDARLSYTHENCRVM